MDKITIVSPCFNEEDNLEELYLRVKEVISKLEKYQFEILFIDNNSTDNTKSILRGIASKDKSVKVIFNNRNYGHIRSPYWGILNSTGDATIYLASDLQDPPELIADLIKEWEDGNEIVLAVKPRSKENWISFMIRKAYYRILNVISEVPLTNDTTGFGLYDKKVVDNVKKVNDPYPYFRGLIHELGFQIKTIEFEQQLRTGGISKNNFYTLYDIAMLGIISHSKLPIRIASFMGIGLGLCSLIGMLAIIYIKITDTHLLAEGVATIATLILFLFGVLFILIGLLGEYILSIHTFIKNRPIVTERERLNFD